MARGKTTIIPFKAGYQHQVMLFPPDLNDLIAANHPVRVVNQVIDQIDLTQLLQQYKPGGTSSYHPRMLLKVLVYAYINNIYSSRKIEEALTQNICYMWLSGMQKPDHNTVNRFRGQRLQKSLRPIFTQVVLLLCDEGLLSIKDLYTDGTKIEANANRYTFVWGNSIKSNREKIKGQLNDLWKYAQSVAASELNNDDDPDGFEKIDSEKVTQTITAINEALKDQPIDKKVKQKLGYANKHWPTALDKYERQEAIIGTERRSYSKTDLDATFMRLKEDHMRNGQLKPAYNLQLSSNNQYITNYTLHQHATDTNTLVSHLQQFIKDYKVKPTTVTADAGYGSEKNYQWLENKRITAYVKHNAFDRNQNSRIRAKKPYSTDKLSYNAEKDQFLCPSGKAMKNIGSYQTQPKNGFSQTLTKYQAKNCNGCPLREQCHQQKGNRIIEVNHNLNRLRSKADKRLNTTKGIEKRKQRCVEIESVFGNIKQNHHFRRFMLRGIDKVSIETGLIAIAHNIRKKIA
jgi:transposase